VLRTDHLTSADVNDVLAMARDAGDADGAYPLSEHVALHIRHGGEAPAVHVLARSPEGELVGYAHVDTTDEVEGPSAELVVHPMHRRHGLGRALVREAIAIADERDVAASGRSGAEPAVKRPSAGGATGRLRLWAHGDHPSANALALSLGFERARVLWQMRRSLYAEIPAVRLPEGVTLRPFRPGQDDEAWVALNARAFADHPDQGRWTLHDLHVRMAEPWFDPEGFLLAETGSRLLGFHWTKVHGGHVHTHPAGTAVHAHEPIGEVSVQGVDPAAHGHGLGAALTLAGLRHLRARGLDQAMLYVDEANERAVAMYTKLGFARWSTDVSFRRS
jgi:mycothiol synthase